MQIVINIPEQMHLNAKADLLCGGEIIAEAIKNGTPLPKGHGELITKEQAIELVEFYQMNPQHFNFVDLIDEIKAEKPIIEADKVEREVAK